MSQLTKAEMDELLISEIQIVPIKPKDGLVAFASFIYDGNLYLSSIGIYTKLSGGYRLAYPTRKTPSGDIRLFHPINKSIAEKIDHSVIKKFEEVTKQYDRYDKINTG